MSIVTIKLSSPLIGPRGEVREIRLQAPSFDAYMLNGEPYTVAETADGARYAVESMDVIQAYVAECLVDKEHLNLLSQGDALLGRKVRKAVLGFFQDGGEATAASPTSSTTSSSS